MNKCLRILFFLVAAGVLSDISLEGQPARFLQIPSAGAPGTTLVTPYSMDQAEERAFDDDFQKLLPAIGKERYPECKSPNPLPKIHFDFSAPKTVSFEYSQKMMTGTEPAPIVSESRGLLQVRTKGDGLASLVLKNLKSSIKEGDGPPSAEMGTPPITIPDIDENGTLVKGAKDTQPFLRMAVGIPSAELAQGKSVEIPAQLQTNILGKQYPVHGIQRVMLTRFVTISGKTCARLDTRLDISRLEAPEEVKDKHRLSTRGGSVQYWDLESHELVSAEMVFEMAISSGEAKGKEDPEKKTPPPGVSDPLTLKSTFLIAIRRKVSNPGTDSD